MRIALIPSAHGFGHLTRQLALGAQLRALGHDLVVLTAAVPRMVEETLPGAPVVHVAVDVGVVQADALSLDVPATRLAVARATGTAALQHLTDLVAGLRLDGAVVDVAPAALEACRRAGVPAVAVASFDWPWIYRHLPGLEGLAPPLEAWQGPHPAIELWPGPGLQGFRHVVRRRWLVARRGLGRDLGVPGPVLVGFGGLGLRHLDALLPRVEGVTWITCPPQPPLPRTDALHLSWPFPDLVASCEVVVSKPGYGILAECLASGRPLAWLHRPDFPEMPSLEAVLRERGDPCVDATNLAETVRSLVGLRREPMPVHNAEVAREAVDRLGR